MRAHLKEVQFCYGKALTKDPTLKGKVVVDFTNGSAGKVTASSFASTTLSDKPSGPVLRA